jgi:hypothetical protein
MSTFHNHRENLKSNTFQIPMKVTVFWSVKPGTLVNRHHRFEGTCYLQLWPEE